MFRKCLAFSLLLVPFTQAADLDIKKVEQGIAIHRVGQDKPILVYNAPVGGRPYVHPLLAPDGKGELTEFSPSHHKHQTGIYVGILKVNGKDYFHNRDANYFLFKEGGKGKNKNTATWEFQYDWLNGEKDKKAVLTETQKWTLADFSDHYLLDLDWSAEAKVDVVFGQYDYGGLFLRMPWTSKTGGEAVNAEGLRGGQAEGKRSKWVSVGMPIEGRDKTDWGNIAILDHKANSVHPTPWRVDGNLGVGPARSRLGEWKLAKGETAKARYRLFVFTGPFNADKVEAEWKKWSEQP